MSVLAKKALIRFACPHCGQTGEVLWSGDGADRALVRLSSGFHVEDGRLPGTRHVIICGSCDEIDPAPSAKAPRCVTVKRRGR